MDSIDYNVEINITNHIIKLVSKHFKLKKLDNIKQSIINILLNDLNKKKLKSKELCIKKEYKPAKSKIKEPKTLDLKNYFECRDRYELDHRLNDIDLLVIMEYHGLDLINIKKRENREIVIEKLFSIISVMKEEQNKHKSLSFLYENNKNNEIKRFWNDKSLLYRNFEINTLLSKSLIYDNMFYIPSQDLFLTLNIRDKRKGKIQEIFVSFEGDVEIINEEKIKLKNLYSIYTDLVDLNQLE